MYKFSNLGFASSAHLNSIKVLLKDFSDASGLKLVRLGPGELELAQEIHGITGWSTNENQRVMKKTFEFGDFQKCFSFMNSISLIAEDIKHYPKWHNCYNKIQVEISSDQVKGISLKDIMLAHSMECIFDTIRNGAINSPQDVSLFVEQNVIENWNQNYEKSTNFAEGLQRNVASL